MSRKVYASTTCPYCSREVDVTLKTREHARSKVVQCDNMGCGKDFMIRYNAKVIVDITTKAIPDDMQSRTDDERGFSRSFMVTRHAPVGPDMLSARGPNSGHLVLDRSIAEQMTGRVFEDLDCAPMEDDEVVENDGGFRIFGPRRSGKTDDLTYAGEDDWHDKFDRWRRWKAANEKLPGDSLTGISSKVPPITKHFDEAGLRSITKLFMKQAREELAKSSPRPLEEWKWKAVDGGYGKRYPSLPDACAKEHVNDIIDTMQDIEDGQQTVVSDVRDGAGDGEAGVTGNPFTRQWTPSAFLDDSTED